MTLIANYATKAECKAAVGKPLRFIETSVFGPEYRANGEFVVANRPHITNKGKEWFGSITMKNGLIARVK